ncbi:unnamed protein product [Prorocentrum cordatum]|uniref:Uncharacterized protein n=1 Tax=Prorocentrum cordatum TaxID=2364126 RepID=A0ABN9TYU0_9DINO|nr:unnamed protein product [Polarella glacialis]
MERAAASRLQSQRDMLRELEELEAAVQSVANELKSRPAKSTAAQKWHFAHGVAAKAPRIEVLVGADFVPKSTMKFWLTETVRLEWQKARVDLGNSPVIRVTGVSENFADGLFDFVPAQSSKGEPPVFQHQRLRSLWMFLGKDQNWWIGSTSDKSGRTPRGIAHMCGPIQPGVVPKADMAFAVSVNNAWEQRRVQVEVVDGLRACDCWAEAARKAGPLELWGCSELFGAFAPEEAGGRGRPPVYGRGQDGGTVLFLGQDGCWCIGTSGEGGRLKEGRIRSLQSVEPGTLPDDPSIAWLERGPQEWSRACGLRFCAPEAVAAAWRAARERAAADPVMRLEGSPGELGYDGLYDYIAEEGREDGPPCFMHQINQERWVYFGADGCWWVGDKEFVVNGLTKGRLCTSPAGGGGERRRKAFSPLMFRRR